jgi:hypothetical protein
MFVSMRAKRARILIVERRASEAGSLALLLEFSLAHLRKMSNCLLAGTEDEPDHDPGGHAA